MIARRLLIFASVLSFAACVGPTLIVQQYSGPVRPRESIAILRVNGDDSVQLLALDDEDVAVPIASDSRLHIELLPGAHTVTFGDAKNRETRPQSLAFQAEAGRVYRIVRPTSPAEMSAAPARVYEVDRSSDAVTRDATTELGEREKTRARTRRLPRVEPSPSPAEPGEVDAAAPVDAAASTSDAATTLDGP